MHSACLFISLFPPHPNTCIGYGPAIALTILASISLAVTSLYTLHCYTLGCKLASRPVARCVFHQHAW